MRLVVLHYHLLRGGVTGIVDAQLAALRQTSPDLPVTVAAGNAAGRTFPGVELLTIPALDYLTADPAAAYTAIRTFLASLPPDAVVHAHNPTLGKNPALTLALYEAAGGGRAILYHIHDFAEDRPDNLDFLRRTIQTLRGGASDDRILREVMYPDFPHCRFAVITRQDGTRLEAAGIAADRIDYLPNPVPEITPADAAAGAAVRRELNVAEDRRFWLYPVRAIPRKNIGEFLLLLALFRHTAVGAITLPPNNPIDRPEYNDWKRFAAERKLPVHFEVGEHYSLPDLMAAADLCLTTSRREGFGMTFVEPWQYGKPVAGRRLAAPSADFTALGMVFRRVYDRLNIPGATDDFSTLPPPEQCRRIAAVLDSADTAAELLAANPVLRTFSAPPDPAELTQNFNVVNGPLSLAEYGRKLNAVYQRFAGSIPRL